MGQRINHFGFGLLTSSLTKRPNRVAPTRSKANAAPSNSGTTREEALLVEEGPGDGLD